MRFLPTKVHGVYVYLPHLIVGLLEIGASLMTETTPSVAVHTIRDRDRRHAH